MIKLSKRYLFSWRPFLTALFLIAGCHPEVTNNDWQITSFITKQKHDETYTEIIDSRNCVSPENKNATCGMEAENSSRVVTVKEGGVKVGVNEQISISAGIDVKSEFEASSTKQSEETISLPSPNTQGFVFRYSILKTYRNYIGTALATSADGESEEVSYVYQAGCTQKIIKVQKLTCSEADRPIKDDNEIITLQTTLNKSIIGKWKSYSSNGIPLTYAYWTFTDSDKLVINPGFDGTYQVLDDQHVKIKNSLGTAIYNVEITPNELHLSCNGIVMKFRKYTTKK